MAKSNTLTVLTESHQLKGSLPLRLRGKFNAARKEWHAECVSSAFVCHFACLDAIAEQKQKRAETSVKICLV